MKTVQFTGRGTLSIVSCTALSFLSHLLSALTCATCWAIFGPALVLLLGSAGTAFMASLRPFAPVALLLSALGLAYSIYRLSQVERSSRKLPFRMALAFTIVSAAG